MGDEQQNTAAGQAATGPLPVAFISHGSPMVAIETGPYQKALERLGRAHRPKAVVVISAHWESHDEIRITSVAKPSLIYDFGGFPGKLYELKYEAPGAPDLARRISGMLRDGGISSTLDAVRGFDHGVWVPLRLMYADAGVPVVELSIPITRSPAELFRIGTLLSPLRAEGVLVLGSGGIVHNLRRLDWQHKGAPPQTWALDFDRWVAAKLDAWDVEGLFRYKTAAPSAALAVPTREHFHPIFVVLGAARPRGRIEYIHEGFEYGTLSMRCFAI
ncbi:MAG: class III extradiol ring-cleavage dioxygenase [Bryobacteraceae bacterium]